MKNLLLKFAIHKVGESQQRIKNAIQVMNFIYQSQTIAK